jgi:hypothetical protein
MLNSKQIKKDARIVFPQVWNAIKNVDVDALYAAGGQPWIDFMSDIACFYVCRYHLFGSHIPIAYHPDLEKQVSSMNSYKAEFDFK